MKPILALTTVGALLGSFAVAACSGSGSVTGRPMGLMLTCSTRNATMGSLTVSVSCSGMNSSGLARSVTLTASSTSSSATLSAHSTNASVASVSVMGLNTFKVAPLSSGATTVQVDDTSGDQIDFNENVEETTDTGTDTP